MRERMMSLHDKQYTELEAIVGKRNLSRDPAVLDGYRYNLSHTAIHLGPHFDVRTPRGIAVALPGNTEEVQEIVRWCNLNKIKYKPSSTFWSAQGYPNEDGVLVLDMRRMDRILEIDPKNMIAVVEPGVIGATLQAETMKVGLNCHIQGSGCSCSILAGATAWLGSGPGNLYGGWQYENLLGAEWILPTGEILRTGSLCLDETEWFSGEGPGPSMRGVMRGMFGTKGSLGIFTKCAVKLHAWPGPAQLPAFGQAPAYTTKLPGNFRAYTLAFPDWEAWADTAHMLWDNGIGYLAHRQFNFLGRDLKYAMIQILTDPTKTISDLEELLKDPEIKEANDSMKIDFQIVLVGMTQRDFDWQNETLKEILSLTGGWIAECMESEHIQNYTLLYLIRLGHKALNLVYGGGYDGNFGMINSIDFGSQRAEEAGRFKKEWEDKGMIVAGGGDCMMGPIGGQGGGGTGLWENFTCFDSADRESTEGALAFFDASFEYTKSKGWSGCGFEKLNALARGYDGYETPRETRDAGHRNSPISDVFRFQAKVYSAVNPNDMGDSYYERLED
jgi:FAD/FMN-containing dehydrogenase